MDVQFLTTEDGMVALSTGLQEAGLPNVARSIPVGGSLDDVVEPMIALVRRIATERWHPHNEESFDHHPMFQLRRVQDAVWMHPIEEHDEAHDRCARYRFGLERCLALLTKGEIMHCESLTRPYRVDAFRGFSTTNGLGLRHGFEIGCVTEKTGPRITQMLGAIADLAGARIISDFDRIAHADTWYGLAGHVLWPCGHARPMDDAPDVKLYDALPLLDEELAAFRNDASAQQQWINDRNERRDIEAIQRRWLRVFE